MKFTKKQREKIFRVVNGCCNTKKYSHMPSLTMIIVEQTIDAIEDLTELKRGRPSKHYETIKDMAPGDELHFGSHSKAVSFAGSCKRYGKQASVINMGEYWCVKVKDVKE